MEQGDPAYLFSGSILKKNAFVFVFFTPTTSPSNETIDIKVAVISSNAPTRHTTEPSDLDNNNTKKHKINGKVDKEIENDNTKFSHQEGK